MDTLERMVVSPAAGVFALATLDDLDVTVGTTIGFVRSGGASVPVLSPFDGRLVGLDAVEGERVTRHQRVAWLRCA